MTIRTENIKALPKGQTSSSKNRFLLVGVAKKKPVLARTLAELKKEATTLSELHLIELVFNLTSRSTMNCCGMNTLTKSGSFITFYQYSTKAIEHSPYLYGGGHDPHWNYTEAPTIQALINKYPELEQQILEWRHEVLTDVFTSYRSYSGYIMVDPIPEASIKSGKPPLLESPRLTEIMELPNLPGRRYMLPPFVNESYRASRNYPELALILWVPNDKSVNPDHEDVIMAAGSFPNKGYKATKGAQKPVGAWLERLYNVT